MEDVSRISPGKTKATQHRNMVDDVNLGPIVLLRDHALKLQKEGQRVLRLETGDPSFPTPVHIQQALTKAMSMGETHYPPSPGLPELRKAIFEKFKNQNKVRVADSDHVLVCNGAMHCLYTTFRALLAQGDEVLVPEPVFTEASDTVKLAGGVPVPWPMASNEGFHLDLEGLEKKVTPHTVAIYVNSPHNPTGAVTGRKELEQLLGFAEQHDLVVVSDEAYEHIIYDGLRHESIGSMPGGEERVGSIFSFSKSYSMTGMRIGYLCSNDDRFIERCRKLIRCSTNGVNPAVQVAALAALTGSQDCVREVVEEYRARREIIYNGFNSLHDLRPFRPQGAFYLWCRISDDWKGYKGKRDSWAMARYLLEKGSMGSVPGIAFGASGEGHMRFSFSCPRDHIEEAVEVASRLLG